jgi:hypothetical protein
MYPSQVPACARMCSIISSGGTLRRPISAQEFCASDFNKRMDDFFAMGGQ